jgi:hypothetical protein
LIAYRFSYWKTITLAGAAVVLIAAITWLLSTLMPMPYRAFEELAGTLLTLIPASVVAGGLIVLKRDRDIEAGRVGLFAAKNLDRAESVLGLSSSSHRPWLPRLWRLLTRHGRLVVGDFVRVKSLAEIHRTLDQNGCLDGLPFLAEMAKFCNRTAIVYRSVDKTYDYGRTKKLKRMHNAVLLTGLRCDGSEHDGCQAQCYLIWKSAWLTRLTENPAKLLLQSPHQTIGGTDLSPKQRKWCAPTYRLTESTEAESRRKYICQFTELHTATAPILRTTLGQHAQPVLDGNVSLPAFVVAILTRLFARVQFLRGGAGFPMMPPGEVESAPSPTPSLQRGDVVRVRSRGEIAATLDGAGRTKGLWFDQEMLKHCGHTYVVASRIDQIIDDASGYMLRMRSPCILLDGVYASGEFLRFCPQHEPIFWREDWLVRVDSNSGPPKHAV